MERYRFDWLHQEAERLGYGSFEIQVKVRAGQVVSAEKVSERKVVTLEDQRRQGEE